MSVQSFRCSVQGQQWIKCSIMTWAEMLIFSTPMLSLLLLLKNEVISSADLLMISYIQPSETDLWTRGTLFLVSYCAYIIKFPIFLLRVDSLNVVLEKHDFPACLVWGVRVTWWKLSVCRWLIMFMIIKIMLTVLKVCVEFSQRYKVVLYK